jgi:serine protease Do
MNENDYFIVPDKPPKRKGTLISIAGLCLISALLGGITSVSLLPRIYPQAFSTIQSPQLTQSALSNSVPTTLVANTNESQSSSPVAQIAKNVGPAVVGVSNFQNAKARFGSSNTGLVEAGSGSGFIVDAQKGYIVTNNHVIDGAKKITVSLSDGRSLDAKLVGTDPRTDLAVLQISDTSNLTAVKLGDSSKLEVGESVVAIGNPGGDEFARSVTTGVISATNRTLEMTGEPSLYNLIQTDAAINPGNSGGPLVNYQGEVIGINSAKYAEQGFEGMGFAIPMSDANPIIQQLIQSGVAKHPALLVSVNDQYLSYAETNKLPLGAYIAEVQPNGPAAKAGIVKGDVITQINNVKIESSSDLVGELYKHKIGEQINITLIREGQTKQVQATLGEVSSSM